MVWDSFYKSGPGQLGEIDEIVNSAENREAEWQFLRFVLKVKLWGTTMSQSTPASPTLIGSEKKKEIKIWLDKVQTSY